MKHMFLICLFVALGFTSLAQITYNFTNAGASGTNGPNQAQVNAAYTATNLAGQVTVVGTGIQQWTVPATRMYSISAAGASGGYVPGAIGGRGREITVEMLLTAGDVIRVLVGQEGGRAAFSFPGYAGGGGGGTFIVNQTTNTLLLACGGGGGSGNGVARGDGIYFGSDASDYLNTSGSSGSIASFNSSGVNGAGGTNGNGGQSAFGSGGGGYFTNGATGFYGGQFGSSYSNGGAGGLNLDYCGGGYTLNIAGGFGGGAGAGICSFHEADGGGGGGYSGGGGGDCSTSAGGGGGNFYTGTYISSSLNTGNGSVSITNLYFADIIQTGFNCNGLSNGGLEVAVNSGTAPFTYLWSNGATTDSIGNLAPGTYSVDVTDFNGQVTNASYTIADPVINSSISGTNFVCPDASTPNKSVTSIEFRWVGTCNNGQTEFRINGQTALLGQAFNSCICSEFVRSQTVTDPNVLALITNGNNTFYGYIGGSLQVWSKAILSFSDGTTQTVNIQNLNGSADFEDTYACGYGFYGSFTVNETIEVTPVYNPTPGSIDLTTSAASINPLTYSWSTDETTQDIVVTSPGMYYVTTTQPDCGYTKLDSIEITVPIVSFSAVVTDGVCADNNSGEIDITTTGFVLPITYQWSNGATSEDLTGLASGAYTVSVRDGSGCQSFASSPFQVTLDTVKPNAICADYTLPLDEFGAATLSGVEVAFNSTDSCGISSYSSNLTSFDCSSLGANNVIITVEDVHGNQRMCAAVVTVVDTIAPAFFYTTPNINFNVAAGLCGKIVTYQEPTGGDFCGAYIQKTDTSGLESGDIFPAGSTPQTYTLTDGSGNETVYTFYVNIIDNQMPVITNSPSNMSVNSAQQECGAIVSWTAPTASDNCPAVVLTSSNAPGSFFPVGTTTVTYTATDAANNVVTSTFDVTVLDATAPSISVIQSITATVNTANCNAVNVDLGTPTIFDNCSTVTVTNNAPTVFALGTTTVTYTATDAAGNTATATQVVTVVSPESSLTVSSCGSYTADNNDVFTSSGNYDLTYTNANGCDSIVHLNLTVEATDFAFAINNGDGSISASNGAAYQWINCATGQAIAGETNDVFVATQSGSYAVEVTSAEGCTDASNCITVNVLGINENMSSTISVFPNPTNQFVTISMDVATAQIELVDAQGKLLQVKTISTGDQIDLSAYETGVYFLKITTDNGSILERIVKN